MFGESNFPDHARDWFDAKKIEILKIQPCVRSDLVTFFLKMNCFDFSGRIVFIFLAKHHPMKRVYSDLSPEKLLFSSLAQLSLLFSDSNLTH